MEDDNTSQATPLQNNEEKDEAQHRKGGESETDREAHNEVKNMRLLLSQKRMHKIH